MAKLDDIEGRLSKKVVDSKEISLTMSTDLPHGIPQIQPSSALPTIPKPSTQSPVESKDGLPTVEEFDELVSAKARLLKDGYERGKAIENLCVLNLDHARMLLYQDYMRFLTTDYEVTSEDWTHIRFHLEQYGKLSRHSLRDRAWDFNCFMTSLGPNIILNKDRKD
jgi:hypothetical protein